MLIIGLGVVMHVFKSEFSKERERMTPKRFGNGASRGKAKNDSDLRFCVPTYSSRNTLSHILRSLTI